MSLLLDLLDKYILSGVPSNAAYDLIKTAWGKAHERSWETLYVDSFRQAVDDNQPLLAKYAAEDGEIGLAEDALRRILHQDLAVDPGSSSFSALTDEQFATRLGRAMAQRSVLLIGGHRLSPDDYVQLVQNLVQQARTRFRQALLDDESGFRRALLDETLATQSSIGDMQATLTEMMDYLATQFGIQLSSRLDEIAGNVKTIQHMLSQGSAIRVGEQKRLTVMISSTIRDLPEHREQVRDACLRLGMFPKMMEHLPASDADAILASLAMVDEADVYLGIVAYRYGYVPAGHDTSITEMEYARASERSIPRLIFLMDDEHLIRFRDVEMGQGATQLDAFKKRLMKERVVSFFQSALDLRVQVFEALSKLPQSGLLPTAGSLGNIPAPPQPYFPHRYSLLYTHTLIGRRAELNMLTDWITKRDANHADARILSVVALGGTGKSALAWKWFNEIAPYEMRESAGRMWWSFSRGGFSFDDFVLQALAYVTNSPTAELERSLSPRTREDRLWDILDREPFLLVLDGLERILVAYTGSGAHAIDDGSSDQWYPHYLRKTVQVGAGGFLSRLATVHASRILVTTRLCPADLENPITDTSIPGSAVYHLQGLSDGDAYDLWRAFGIGASRDNLMQVLRSFGNHPLLVQALAAEVKRYRPAPGDFERWLRDHPNFNPFDLPLTTITSDVLAFALRDLGTREQSILNTVAALRMPADFRTLGELLVGQHRFCPSMRDLDHGLTNLEDRGLLGWDRGADQYEMHPVVRAVVWSALDMETRRSIFEAIRLHFQQGARPSGMLQARSLRDLAPAIELFNASIVLGYHDEAYVIFRDLLGEAAFGQQSTSRECARLLELFFPDGPDRLPFIQDHSRQVDVLSSLALAYEISGEPDKAVPLLRMRADLARHQEEPEEVGTSLADYHRVLRLTGNLREAETVTREALRFSRKTGSNFHEAVSLSALGLDLSTRGLYALSLKALSRALRIMNDLGSSQAAGITATRLTQRAFWIKDYEGAGNWADLAWRLAYEYGDEGNRIAVARLQGMAAAELGKTAYAEERLCYALERARALDLIESEFAVSIALAGLRRQQNDCRAARALLNGVLEAVERGRYPLLGAEAHIVLSHVDLTEGHQEAAVNSAVTAYNLAWREGPPFTYHWALASARNSLAVLGTVEPQLQHSANGLEELPTDSEIDPEDTWHTTDD